MGRAVLDPHQGGVAEAGQPAIGAEGGDLDLFGPAVDAGRQRQSHPWQAALQIGVRHRFVDDAIQAGFQAHQVAGDL